jgi:hypothetical protein
LVLAKPIGTSTVVIVVVLLLQYFAAAATATAILNVTVFFSVSVVIYIDALCFTAI